MVEPTYSSPDAARAMATPATQTSGSATSGEIAFDVFVKNISSTKRLEHMTYCDLNNKFQNVSK